MPAAALIRPPRSASAAALLDEEARLALADGRLHDLEALQAVGAAFPHQRWNVLPAPPGPRAHDEIGRAEAFLTAYASFQARAGRLLDEAERTRAAGRLCRRAAPHGGPGPTDWLQGVELALHQWVAQGGALVWTDRARRHLLARAAAVAPDTLQALSEALRPSWPAADLPRPTACAGLAT